MIPVALAVLGRGGPRSPRERRAVAAAPLHQLLLVIRDHATTPGPTIGQAAQALDIRRHSAVELAQRAETSGLICRERDPLDQRRMHLALADLGRQQLEILTREHLPRIEVLAGVLNQVLQARSAVASRKR
jgi:DNA-binding MarR family transcriptional regulator